MTPIRTFVILLFLVAFAHAQTRPPLNYDEAKVPKYELTDPLKTADGRKVDSAEMWNEVRRPELLVLFANEMYGKPPLPHKYREMHESMGIKMVYGVYTFDGDDNVFNGKGRRYQVGLEFFKEDREKAEHVINVLIYVPNNVKEKTPAFIGLNFEGNHTVTNDPGVRLHLLTTWVRPEGGRDGWDGILVPKPAKEEDRGKQSHRWQVEKVLDRGYAIVTACYHDIEPDFNGGYKHGVRRLFEQKGEPNEANSIATWAWGLSVIHEQISRHLNLNIDPDKIAVIGHSRLGKTALWAGAQDTRFAMVISNNSGCGGATLYRREFGESILLLNLVRPHWFCENFKKYNEKEQSLPFDQHELISLIAPRPVYIASAAEDLPADPRGEFMSALYADPVYRLLGTDGIAGVKEMPKVDQPVGGTIGYHVRTGKHDVTEYDWEQFLNFADKHFKK